MLAINCVLLKPFDYVLSKYLVWILFRVKRLRLFVNNKTFIFCTIVEQFVGRALSISTLISRHKLFTKRLLYVRAFTIMLYTSYQIEFEHEVYLFKKRHEFWST